MLMHGNTFKGEGRELIEVSEVSDACDVADVYYVSHAA